jgi:capsular exopolysaccharide synthesis family protein
MQRHIGSLTATGPDGIPSGQDFVTYGDIAAFVRQHMPTILMSLIAGIALATTYILTAAPIFTARAELIIDPKIPQLLREQTGEVSFSLDNAQVESQIAVLRSEKIGEKVVKQLELADDPEFQASPGLLTRLMNLKLWRPSPAEQAGGDTDKMRAAISMFTDNLEVRRIGLSYAIEILYSSRDPQKAATIANAITEAYVRDQLDTKAQAARQGSEWLEERIDQLRGQMNMAAQAVQRYRATHDYRIIKRTSAAGTEPKDARPLDEPGEASLEELESTAATYRRIYESYLQAFTESVQRQSFPVADARVISPASRPLTKSRPKTSLVLAFGALFGGLAGLGLAFLQHTLDRCVRTPRQVREGIGIDCLGQIARLERPHTPFIATLRGWPRQGLLHNLDEVVQVPFGDFANSMKDVRTAIGLATRRADVRNFGITSALSGTGKSTVTANLAALLAMRGARVLMIDCDLHNPVISRTLAPDAESGIVEVLRGECALSAAVVPVEFSNVHLLPVSLATAGNMAEGELLGSEAMRTLLATARASYDLIVVDLPALKTEFDGLSICCQLDSVLVAAAWGETSIEELAEAVHMLRAARARVLGAVITKVATMSTDSYVRRLHCDQYA